MNITRDLQIELARYNAGIDRSRREYEAHPLAGCGYRGCFELRDLGQYRCAQHTRETGEARDRMSTLRADRRSA